MIARIFFKGVQPVDLPNHLQCWIQPRKESGYAWGSAFSTRERSDISHSSRTDRFSMPPASEISILRGESAPGRANQRRLCSQRPAARGAPAIIRR